ncbi:MAG: hypothetical protein WCX70_00650 [Candidatus Paceibacterota bacterium]|jgi:hypothetical protein
MSKLKIFIVTVLSVIVFLLVFSPHFFHQNSLPFHIDEWHHIEQGLKMGNYGEYFKTLQAENANRFTGIEMGFHLILFFLSQVVSLISIYQFLPALWAVLGGLVIFYLIYKKTEHNFLIALVAMIFFASIKSNVNITGLWFFTPLSFSIPLIYLYTYYFTEGFYKEDKKKILYGLFFMIALVPIHSISVLFLVPVMLFYAALNYKFVLKNKNFFLSFLIIPITGLLFYKYTLDIPWVDVSEHLFEQLKFKYGWGVYEIRNSFTEVYSLIGYLLAIIGAGFLLYYKKAKRFSFYLIWAIYALFLINLYRLTGISFLSPYQRNLYYLALSLPPLSALGFYFLTTIITRQTENFLAPQTSNDTQKAISIKIDLTPQQKVWVKNIFVLTVSVLIIAGALVGYYKLPPDLELYKVIDEDDYKTLNFLAHLPKGTVMATPLMSAALYPIAHQNPVAKLAFYGNVEDIERFFLKANCNEKNQIIKERNINYIVSPVPLDCPYEVIYAEHNVIYRTNASFSTKTNK